MADPQPTVLESIVRLLIPGVIIGGLSAWLTVRLALRRFYVERWWERKEKAYTNIIESLYDVRHYAVAWLEESEKGGELNEERHKVLNDLRMAGETALLKAAAIGDFTISKESAAILVKFQADMKELEPTLELRPTESYAEDEIELVTKCLEAIRDAAKRDLKIR